MMRRPPRSLLCPHTTLFRSRADGDDAEDRPDPRAGEQVRRLGRDGRPPRAPGDAEQAGMQPEQPVLRRVVDRSEEYTSELQSRQYLVCRLLLEKKKTPPLPN